MQVFAIGLEPPRESERRWARRLDYLRGTRAKVAAKVGDRYDSHAYRRAIDYAIRKANKAVEKAA